MRLMYVSMSHFIPNAPHIKHINSCRNKELIITMVHSLGKILAFALLHSILQGQICLEPLRSCPILCDPMDCSPPASFVRGVSQSCHFLLQGIFWTQESNTGLLHWQVDSLLLSHQGNPLARAVPTPKNSGVSVGAPSKGS